MNKEEFIKLLFLDNDFDSVYICEQLLNYIPQNKYSQIINEILSSPVDKALKKLESDFIIKNGEGTNYQLYFKYNKSLDKKLLFLLKNEDFYIKQLSLCKKNNYYGVYVSENYENITECTLHEIKSHVEYYSSYNGNDYYDFLL